VLTVVSGALAQWLSSHGVRAEGLEMRALVPVSVRTEAHRGTLGNQLTAMRGPLPVYIRDPVARLRFVRRAMDGLKESKQAVGAATLAAVNNLAPPTILAQASRLNFSTRLFNLLVTNIPGPQFPLYLHGRRLEDLFPLAFLPKNHALAVAIMSYDGGLDYGLLGDYDALPDIDLIADGIEAALRELLEAVPRARPRSGPSATEAPASPSGRASGNGAGGNGVPVRPAAQILPTAGARPARGPAADMRAKRSGRSGSARKRSRE
jgi:diacylglycerol O-acyltransferase